MTAFKGCLKRRTRKAPGFDSSCRKFANLSTRNKTIIIGDTTHDYDVALQLGLRPVMFTSGHNSKEKLEALGTPCANNYKELLELIISLK